MKKFISSITTFSQLKFLCVAIILVGTTLRAPLTSLGPILSELQRELALNDSAAGLLHALPLLLFGLLSLVAPGLGRRFQMERVIAFALLAITFGTLVRSLPFAGAVWIGTVMLSSGIALGNVLLPGLIKREYPQHTATVIALYAASMAGFAGLAAGVAVPISQFSYLDWRWSIGCWALLSAVALIVWLPILVRSASPLAANTTRNVVYKSPWRDAIGWQVALFFAFHSLIFYSIVGWFASYAVSVGMSAVDAGFYLLIYQLVAIVTNLSCAPIIAKCKDQTLLGFCCGVFLLIGTAGLYFYPQHSLLWIICMGCGAGASMTTSLALFGLRSHDHHQASALSGMAQFIGYIGAALGPFLIGVLREQTNAWTAPLWILIAASVMVIIFATLAGRKKLIGHQDSRPLQD